MKSKYATSFISVNLYTSLLMFPRKEVTDIKLLFLRLLKDEFVKHNLFCPFVMNLELLTRSWLQFLRMELFWRKIRPITMRIDFITLPDLSYPYPSHFSTFDLKTLKAQTCKFSIAGKTRSYLAACALFFIYYMLEQKVLWPLHCRRK